MNIQVIMNAVCRQFEVSHAELKSKSREQHVAYARFMVALIAREHTILSLRAIGKKLGGRDHSSIIHAVERARHMIEHNEAFRGHHEDTLARLNINQTKLAA